MNPDDTTRTVLEVASVYGYATAELHSRFRYAHLAWARKVAYYVLHRRGASYSEIGRYFGRDHSTIISGVRKVAEWVEDNPAASGLYPAFFR